MSVFDTVIRYTGTNLQNWTWSVQQVVNRIMNGKTNNTGELTLDENESSTEITVAHGRLGEDTAIFFMPTTANAATELGAGNMYVSSRSISTVPDETSSFTITHSNSGQTDRTFKFILVG